MKDAEEIVQDGGDKIRERWKRYFEEQVNDENDKEMRMEVGDSVNEEVLEVIKAEVRVAMKKTKLGKDGEDAGSGINASW